MSEETAEKAPKTVNGMHSDLLQGIIDRLEDLETTKKGVADDIKAEKADAKSKGFDVPTINELIKLRKKDPVTVQEEELLLATYKRAMGMEI